VHDGGIGAIPLGKSDIAVSWNVPERDTGDNLEELVAHFLEIWSELVLNVDNESGCDCGGQTDLFSQKTQIYTTNGADAKKKHS